jgi:hypothetical protein
MEVGSLVSRKFFSCFRLKDTTPEAFASNRSLSTPGKIRKCYCVGGLGTERNPSLHYDPRAFASISLLAELVVLTGGHQGKVFIK